MHCLAQPSSERAMSSNFHNLRGMHLNGLELHDYIAAPAVEMPGHFHASGQFWFFQPMATLWKKADRVTAENLSMLQQGYDFYLVPHCPVPVPPPGPGEIPLLAKVIVTSGSKCQMAVLSVTSGGNPLACCISNMLSANQNCSDPIDIELNLVMNLNSVETTPTAGDYAAAVASGLVDKAMGAAFGWGAGKAGERFKGKNKLMEEYLEDVLKQVWRRAPDVVKQIEQWTTTPVAEFVKQMVDGSSS